jgi:hypothetical protein
VALLPESLFPYVYMGSCPYFIGLLGWEWRREGRGSQPRLPPSAWVGGATVIYQGNAYGTLTLEAPWVALVRTHGFWLEGGFCCLKLLSCFIPQLAHIKLAFI